MNLLFTAGYLDDVDWGTDIPQPYAISVWIKVTLDYPII